MGTEGYMRRIRKIEHCRPIRSDKQGERGSDVGVVGESEGEKGEKVGWSVSVQCATGYGAGSWEYAQKAAWGWKVRIAGL